MKRVGGRLFRRAIGPPSARARAAAPDDLNSAADDARTGEPALPYILAVGDSSLLVAREPAAFSRWFCRMVEGCGEGALQRGCRRAARTAAAAQKQRRSARARRRTNAVHPPTPLSAPCSPARFHSSVFGTRLSVCHLIRPRGLTTPVRRALHQKVFAAAPACRARAPASTAVLCVFFAALCFFAAAPERSKRQQSEDMNRFVERVCEQECCWR